MTTPENLRQAVVEEFKNRQMYLAFAEKADTEEKPQIARLFRAIAESEFIHARAELRILGDVRSTAENLQYAANTEEREFQDTYAQFLREANDEGDAITVELLKKILAVEKSHHALYLKALAMLQEGKDLPNTPVLVCHSCGNTVVGSPPEECPICGSSGEQFFEVI